MSTIEQKLRDLANTPPHARQGVRETVLSAFHEPALSESDLLLAVMFACTPGVVDDEIVRELIGIARSAERPVPVRIEAIDSLVESVQEVCFDIPEMAEDMPMTRAAYDSILGLVYGIHADASAPTDVRRAALEAWADLPEARDCREEILRAWSTGEEEWQATAVRCMRHRQDFEDLILQALGSASEGIRYEAVISAGRSGVRGAWPAVSQLLISPSTPRHMLLAALGSAWNIKPKRSQELLARYVASEDPEISAVAAQALEMAASACDVLDMARRRPGSPLADMNDDGEIESRARSGHRPPARNLPN
jgi:hypothetical protein